MAQRQPGSGHAAGAADAGAEETRFMAVDRRRGAPVASLQVAATLCGLHDTELIAEALELYAEKQRGKTKQALLTAAREARRLGEDDA